MRTTASATRMLYKQVRRIKMKRSTKKKVRVGDVMKMIAMTRMPYKRTKHLIQIKRSAKKKKARVSPSREPASSSQSSAALDEINSLSGNDEVREAFVNTEENTSPPPSADDSLPPPTRGEIMREIFAIYGNVPDEIVLEFHRSITKYAFDYYGAKAFFVEDEFKTAP
ncbi:hypothetical protein Q1695_000925 [Nippostrongylus brasiliensis]|nr:hypothetical protein Q1695_000925 [Nippostrongylus brasiliensis]